MRSKPFRADTKRRLLNGLTLLSLLLCVAVVALWLRSYGGCDVVVRPRGPGDRLCVTSEFGVLIVEWESPPPGLVVQPGWEYFQTPLPPSRGKAQGSISGLTVNARSDEPARRRRRTRETRDQERYGSDGGAQLHQTVLRS